MTARVPVCVLAKPPLPGVAKTRLGRAVGARCAADLAAAMFQDTWAMIGGLRWARPILATTTLDTRAFGVAEPVEAWLQGEGDLGDRMERVLARAVAEAGRALLIGSDLPALPASRLEAARDALAHADAVLGPADDGGFYLVGARRVPPGLFAGVPFGRADTLAATHRRFAEVGLAAARIDPWFDLDEPGDLAPTRAAIELDPCLAPRTLAVLRAMEEETCGSP